MTEAKAHVPGGDATLWFGLLAGPVAWGAQLQLVYVLATPVCAGDSSMLLHVTSLALLFLAFAGGAVAWRAHLVAGPDEARLASEPAGRTSFMAMLGLLSSALFALTIVAQWLAVVFLDPCPPTA
jgi:hypothetical protein